VEKIAEEKLERKIGEMTEEICHFYIGKLRTKSTGTMLNGYIKMEENGGEITKIHGNIGVLNEYTRVCLFI